MNNMNMIIIGNTHELKCQTKFYQLTEKGIKNFEIRKNDRNFKVGDYVSLIEVVGEVETGRKLLNLEIRYIFNGGAYGLDSDYVILQF